MLVRCHPQLPTLIELERAEANNRAVNMLDGSGEEAWEVRRGPPNPTSDCGRYVETGCPSMVHKDVSGEEGLAVPCDLNEASWGDKLWLWVLDNSGLIRKLSCVGICAALCLSPLAPVGFIMLAFYPVMLVAKTLIAVGSSGRGVMGEK